MSVNRPPEDNKTEAFPTLSPIVSNNVEHTSHDKDEATTQNITRRRGSSFGRATKMTRSASLVQSLMESNPPLGAWQVIGEDAMRSPTISEIKDGAYSAEGWSHEGQLEKRNHRPHDIYLRRLSRASSQSKRSRSIRTSTGTSMPASPTVMGETTVTHGEVNKHEVDPSIVSRTGESYQSATPPGPDETGEYPNGYRFPKKHTWQQSCVIYGKAFWKFFITVKGFLITIYALNVVAWGAMIFFLLIPGATPEMCKSYPDCNDKRYSARQIWIENTSQILTALFCVTAFGLLPWRLRDFYYMIRYQAFGDYDALRKLAGFYRSWYRLPGSDKLPELLGPPPAPANLKAKSFLSLKKKKKQPEPDAEKLDIDEDIAELDANPAVPLPPWSMPPAPLTGIRARPTKFSALVWMIWMYIWNTLFQVGLCVVMWGFDRFQRNKAYFSALTALFIVLGCGTGIAAGIVVGKEGKVVKQTEGIPIKEYDMPETAEDFQQRMEKKEKKEKKKKDNSDEAIQRIKS